MNHINQTTNAANVRERVNESDSSLDIYIYIIIYIYISNSLIFTYFVK